MSLYSVVVPVYNSEHTLTELYTRLDKVFRETVQEPFELILVDDGSKDCSYQIMEELRQKDPRVKIIQMARNFGQHPALPVSYTHLDVYKRQSTYCIPLKLGITTVIFFMVSPSLRTQRIIPFAQRKVFIIIRISLL